VDGKPQGASLSPDRNKNLVLWQREAHIDLDSSGERIIEFPNIKLPRSADKPNVQFTAYAFNDDRVKSETCRKTYKPTHALKGPTKGKVYLITIGVAASEDAHWNLFYPANDARSLQEDLYDRLSMQYRQVVRVQLVSDYAGITKRAGECVEKKPT